MCNIIDVETQNNMPYIFFPVSSSAVRFKVKAPNDIHVALTKGSSLSSSRTELNIGRWGNTHSTLMKDGCDPDRVQVSSDVLNRDEYVGMWISWYGGRIAAGLEGSETPFISYDDPFPSPIDHVAIRSDQDSCGSWKIEVSPVILKPISPKPLTGELRWVQMYSEDVIPNDAVVGGYEGEVVFVARARHNRSLCPGKYVPSMKRAIVPWGRETHEKESFEILCGYNYMWVETSGDFLPPHAFPGGNSDRNAQLFIGRAFREGCLIPGKVDLQYKNCYIPNGMSEDEVHNYEVLVDPSANTAHLYGPRRRCDCEKFF